MLVTVLTGDISFGPDGNWMVEFEYDPVAGSSTMLREYVWFEGKPIAAIRMPDAMRTEVLKGFVVLRDGAQWEGLEAALIARVRERVSPHVAPRMIEWVESLPMTATGKIIRRELRGD
jgi:acyl-CoA synthetase (AMP-forming)/AMP-acid ligase II